MCYSAQVEAGYKKYVREWGADISLAEFFRLYWEGASNSRIKIPKAMDAAFANPQTDFEREIKKAIDQRNADQVAKPEQDIFKRRSGSLTPNARCRQSPSPKCGSVPRRKPFTCYKRTRA